MAGEIIAITVMADHRHRTGADIQATDTANRPGITRPQIMAAGHPDITHLRTMAAANHPDTIRLRITAAANLPVEAEASLQAGVHLPVVVADLQVAEAAVVVNPLAAEAVVSLQAAAGAANRQVVAGAASQAGHAKVVVMTSLEIPQGALV